MSEDRSKPATPTNRLAGLEEQAAAPLADVQAYHAAGQPAVDDQPGVELEPGAVEASTPFVGQWRTLVSTTNWEKGAIICRWRASLESTGAAATQFSDEAWAQLVGGVTSQHVGRLRRVHARFGAVYPEYDGLYWSHFQAACEWDDAEMWLEGALQNGWSVSQMRGQRWEVTGVGPAPAASGERDAAIASGMADVADPAPQGGGGGGQAGHAAADDQDTPQSANRRDQAPEEGSEGGAPLGAEASGEAGEPWGDPPPGDSAATPAAVRPFAELPELPEDLADAFEQFKLAILNHKLAGWAEVSRADLLGVLDSLKLLAQAPGDSE
ncbi:MAG: hypothetical protein AAF790_10960 [Planctomycetota bacterium]